LFFVSMRASIIILKSTHFYYTDADFVDFIEISAFCLAVCRKTTIFAEELRINDKIETA